MHHKRQQTCSHSSSSASRVMALLISGLVNHVVLLNLLLNSRDWLLGFTTKSRPAGSLRWASQFAPTSKATGLPTFSADAAANGRSPRPGLKRILQSEVATVHGGIRRWKLFSRAADGRVARAALAGVGRPTARPGMSRYEAFSLATTGPEATRSVEIKLTGRGVLAVGLGHRDQKRGSSASTLVTR